MTHFQIVAHRGIPDEAPENTLASFERAIQLGADAVELDVRLTADGVPVVFHYYYLEMCTTAAGPIFNFSLEQLRPVQVFCKDNPAAPRGRISTLVEVLEAIGGRIGLEIEVKGPEPEAPGIIGRVLRDFSPLWERIEVTSYEPALLLAIREICPGLTVDLLFPRSEPWMKLDVTAYQAAEHARLAHTRAVHLHPTQLTEQVVRSIRGRGIEIHAWDVNDEAALRLVSELGIPRICTDRFLLAKEFRQLTG